jgi:hypothetical protein
VRMAASSSTTASTFANCTNAASGSSRDYPRPAATAQPVKPSNKTISFRQEAKTKLLLGPFGQKGLDGHPTRLWQCCIHSFSRTRTRPRLENRKEQP